MENPTQTFKEKPCASARIVCIGVSPPPPSRSFLPSSLLKSANYPSPLFYPNFPDREKYFCL